MKAKIIRLFKYLTVCILICGGVVAMWTGPVASVTASSFDRPSQYVFYQDGMRFMAVQNSTGIAVVNLDKDKLEIQVMSNLLSNAK